MVYALLFFSPQITAALSCDFSAWTRNILHSSVILDVRESLFVELSLTPYWKVQRGSDSPPPSLSHTLFLSIYLYLSAFSTSLSILLTFHYFVRMIDASHRGKLGSLTFHLITGSSLINLQSMES